jgi:hypothetical protein
MQAAMDCFTESVKSHQLRKGDIVLVRKNTILIVSEEYFETGRLSLGPSRFTFFVLYQNGIVSRTSFWENERFERLLKCSR